MDSDVAKDMKDEDFTMKYEDKVEDSLFDYPPLPDEFTASEETVNVEAQQY